MYTIGLDIGSVAAKAVAFDGKRIIAKTILPTAGAQRKQAIGYWIW